MRLPIKRPQSASLLSLPDLSGGLNLRDGVSEILNNQLTDCKNMWWNDGVLTTRPGMRENEKLKITGSAGQNINTKIKMHNCYKSFGGVKARLCSVDTFKKTSSETAKGYISFFWCFEGRLEAFSSIIFDTKKDMPDSYFVCQLLNELYCFTSNSEIYRTGLNENNKWSKVEESEYYIPTVLTSCRKIASKSVTQNQVMGSGVMIEGFNILSDYYKMEFNSYNPEIVTEENPKHEMRYHIIESVAKAKYAGKKVTAEYTKDGIVYTHIVELTDENQDKENSNTWNESKAKEDGLLMRVWRNNVTFWNADGTIATLEDGDEGDLVITAPYIIKKAEKQKVFGMQRTEWFGGGTEGLSGGTRLFLCGNKKHADLVLWSGLNNPLYFPENSYFYVGNTTEAVTGFGKQSDKLVIFKEHETWYTQYNQNTDITAASLINQNVVDYTSSAVYFPLVLINSNIGCGYPDTVQLCRNRLVWLGSDKKVYSLVSESAYNERSIYCVSEMVDKRIKAIAKKYDISQASACDWEGHYCLLLKDTLLLMDYNCYGYTHIAGHSKTEDANIKIPWFLWKLPKGAIVMNIGGLATLEFKYESLSSCSVRSFHFGNYSADIFNDGECEIESYFATKVFTAGIPHIRKNIEQINLQLGNNGGVPIIVIFITDNGTEQETVTLFEDQTQNDTAGFIESRAVFPCIKQIIRFGLKLQSKGMLAVDSVIIKYRTTGGAR